MCDILRFYNYNFNEAHTTTVVQYNQVDNTNEIKCIFEIEYNKECHELLFGNLPESEIQTYVEGVKKIPKNVKGEEAKQIYNYLEEKKKMSTMYTNKIQISPKVVDSQSRVQCRINNFEDTLKDFITYKSSPNKPNCQR